LDIVKLSSTSFLLTLDGEANLDIYLLSDSAYLKAYLPGTVNSSNIIFVPSTIQAPVYDQISIPSSVANVDLVGVSKVDWLLQDNQDGTMDLATTNSGDFRLSAGITNLIQALSIKLKTQKGTVYALPDFGLSFKVGTMNSDFRAQDIYNDITNLITSDPRFSGVSGLQIQMAGPALIINLGVQVTGQTGVFPIGFSFGNQ
jgi:hypothetical protein